MFAKKTSSKSKPSSSFASDDSAGYGIGANYTGINFRLKNFEIKYQIAPDTSLIALRLYKGEKFYWGGEFGYADATIAGGVETGVFFGFHKRFGKLGVYLDAGPYLVAVWQKNRFENNYNDFGIIFNTGVNFYFK